MFVCLPTESGKSLCYCLLPATYVILCCLTSSVIVVVSPLVALLKDQVSRRRVHYAGCVRVHARVTDKMYVKICVDYVLICGVLLCEL